MTLSPRFEEVLPTIANPPSPWRKVAAEYLVCHHGAGDREEDYAHWKRIKRFGMEKIVVLDHEVGWRDCAESFTFRTVPAPGKGGDEGQREYAERMRELGFRYGLYNNYAGLITGNKSDDRGYNLARDPWLVDFDLRKLHPLGCDVGFGKKNSFSDDMGKALTVEDWDRFFAGTIVYGHVGEFFNSRGAINPLMLRSYFLLQQLQCAYAAAEIQEIRYADEQGNLLETSTAVATDAFRRSQFRLTCDNGLVIWVNGHLEETWRTPHAELPPGGYLARSADGRLHVSSSLVEGRRVDQVFSPTYDYLDGRGKLLVTEHGAADRQLIILKRGDGSREAIPYQSTRFAVAMKMPPPMERFAREGMRFTQAYAQPLCSPTRASILTGQTAARHGITAPACHTPPRKDVPPPPITRNDLDPTHYTLAKALRDAGYRTGHFGKWHLGLVQEHWPEAQGFEVTFHAQPSAGPPSYFSPYLVFPPGVDKPRIVDGYATSTGTITDGPKGEYITDRLTDESIRFVRESKAAGKPFFLNLWHYAVHGPWGHKEEYTRKFAHKKDPTGCQGNPIMASMLKSVRKSPRSPNHVPRRQTKETNHEESIAGRSRARLGRCSGVGRNAGIRFPAVGETERRHPPR